jgi:hypothetical protein
MRGKHTTEFAEFLDSRIRCELTRLGRSDVRAESECACLHEAIGCKGRGGMMVQLELKLPKTHGSRRHVQLSVSAAFSPVLASTAVLGIMIKTRIPVSLCGNEPMAVTP